MTLWTDSTTNFNRLEYDSLETSYCRDYAKPMVTYDTYMVSNSYLKGTSYPILCGILKCSWDSIGTANLTYLYSLFNKQGVA